MWDFHSYIIIYNFFIKKLLFPSKTSIELLMCFLVFSIIIQLFKRLICVHVLSVCIVDHMFAPRWMFHNIHYHIYLHVGSVHILRSIFFFSSFYSFYSISSYRYYILYVSSITSKSTINDITETKMSVCQIFIISCHFIICLWMVSYSFTSFTEKPQSKIGDS